MKAIQFITTSILLILFFAYTATATLLLFSEGCNQELTIWNFVGMLMFGLPYAIYKLKTTKTK